MLTFKDSCGKELSIWNLKQRYGIRTSGVDFAWGDAEIIFDFVNCLRQCDGCWLQHLYEEVLVDPDGFIVFTDIGFGYDYDMWITQDVFKFEPEQLSHMADRIEGYVQEMSAV